MLNTYDERAVANLTAALKIFQDATKGSCVVASVALLQAFLAVALKPGASVGELAKHFDLPNGTTSRMLSDLSDTSRSGNPGLGLIDQKIYHLEGRHTRNRLSVKGAALAARISSALTRQPVARAA
jgi:DNA-binding MarR family transcriptional regulator